MKNVRNKRGFAYVWLIVDKRGQYFEHGDYLIHGFKPDHSFPGVVWASRRDARFVIARYKASMSAEAWKTWQMKAIGYKRITHKEFSHQQKG
jgi:hypothetical protein